MYIYRYICDIYRIVERNIPTGGHNSPNLDTSCNPTTADWRNCVPKWSNWFFIHFLVFHSFFFFFGFSYFHSNGRYNWGPPLNPSEQYCWEALAPLGRLYVTLFLGKFCRYESKWRNCRLIDIFLLKQCLQEIYLIQGYIHDAKLIQKYIDMLDTEIHTWCVKLIQKYVYLLQKYMQDVKLIQKYIYLLQRYMQDAKLIQKYIYLLQRYVYDAKLIQKYN